VSFAFSYFLKNGRCAEKPLYWGAMLENVLGRFFIAKCICPRAAVSREGGGSEREMTVQVGQIYLTALIFSYRRKYIYVGVETVFSRTCIIPFSHSKIDADCKKQRDSINKQFTAQSIADAQHFAAVQEKLASRRKSNRY